MTPPDMIALGVLVMILVPIISIDVRERRIPNLLNALLALAGLAVQLATTHSFRAALVALGAAVGIILLFVGLIALMKALKRPGTLGFGDVKFLAAASIWVGFVGSTAVFVVASLLALAFTVLRAPWHRVDFRAAIPFSPFLAVSLALIFAGGAATAPTPAIAEPVAGASST